MIKTRQKTRKQISNLSLDIEIVNPIESKTLFGGCNYSWHYSDCSCGSSSSSGGFAGSMMGYFGFGSSSGSQYIPDNNNYSSGGWGGQGSIDTNFMDNNRDGIDDALQNVLLPNHSNHICTQLPQSSTCATMALSYVANYFGANGLSSSDFAEMVGNDYYSMFMGQPNPHNNNIFSDGLTEQQLSTIMSNIFQSSIIGGSIAEVESQLLSGHPILASIDLGAGNGHEVVIVGFDAAAGTVSYMDSSQGGLVTSNVSQVNFTSQLYAVTGLQNNSIVNRFNNDTNDLYKCSICNH
jgi:Peptidase_C39 like family